MTTLRALTLAALTATALLTSACHKKAEAPANEANVAEPLPEAPPPLENVMNTAEPAPTVKETAVAPADNYELSDEEQIRQDAEATGMTSRTHSGDQGNTNAQR